jgi:hypothetical protein
MRIGVAGLRSNPWCARSAESAKCSRQRSVLAWTLYAAYDSLLELAAAGEITLDLEPVPLADVEQAWSRTDDGRRVVFVP